MPPRLESAREAVPKPVMRGQKEEETPAVRIPAPEELGLGAKQPLPSPEELGLAIKKPLITGEEALDWPALERRLAQLGVTGYQLEKREGVYRFSCTRSDGLTVGRGATIPEALRQVFTQLAK